MGYGPDPRAASFLTQRKPDFRIERAEKGPSLGTILGLVRALGMPAGEIVSMVEDGLTQKKR